MSTAKKSQYSLPRTIVLILGIVVCLAALTWASSSLPSLNTKVSRANHHHQQFRSSSNDPDVSGTIDFSVDSTWIPGSPLVFTASFDQPIPYDVGFWFSFKNFPTEDEEDSTKHACAYEQENLSTLPFMPYTGVCTYKDNKDIVAGFLEFSRCEADSSLDYGKMLLVVTAESGVLPPNTKIECRTRVLASNSPRALLQPITFETDVENGIGTWTLSKDNITIQPPKALTTQPVVSAKYIPAIATKQQRYAHGQVDALELSFANLPSNGLSRLDLEFFTTVDVDSKSKQTGSSYINQVFHDEMARLFVTLTAGTDLQGDIVRQPEYNCGQDVRLFVPIEPQNKRDYPARSHIYVLTGANPSVNATSCIIPLQLGRLLTLQFADKGDVDYVADDEAYEDADDKSLATLHPRLQYGDFLHIKASLPSFDNTQGNVITVGPYTYESLLDCTVGGSTKLFTHKNTCTYPLKIQNPEVVRVDGKEDGPFALEQDIYGWLEVPRHVVKDNSKWAKGLNESIAQLHFLGINKTNTWFYDNIERISVTVWNGPAPLPNESDKRDILQIDNVLPSNQTGHYFVNIPQGFLAQRWVKVSNSGDNMKYEKYFDGYVHIKIKLILKTTVQTLPPGVQYWKLEQFYGNHQINQPKYGALSLLPGYSIFTDDDGDHSVNTITDYFMNYTLTFASVYGPINVDPYEPVNTTLQSWFNSDLTYNQQFVVDVESALYELRDPSFPHPTGCLIDAYDPTTGKVDKNVQIKFQFIFDTVESAHPQSYSLKDKKKSIFKDHDGAYILIDVFNITTKHLIKLNCHQPIVPGPKPYVQGTLNLLPKTYNRFNTYQQGYQGIPGFESLFSSVIELKYNTKDIKYTITPRIKFAEETGEPQNNDINALALFVTINEELITTVQKQAWVDSVIRTTLLPSLKEKYPELNDALSDVTVEDIYPSVSYSRWSWFTSQGINEFDTTSWFNVNNKQYNDINHLNHKGSVLQIIIRLHKIVQDPSKTDDNNSLQIVDTNSNSTTNVLFWVGAMLPRAEDLQFESYYTCPWVNPHDYAPESAKYDAICGRAHGDSCYSSVQCGVNKQTALGDHSFKQMHDKCISNMCVVQPTTQSYSTSFMLKDNDHYTKEDKTLIKQVYHINDNMQYQLDYTLFSPRHFNNQTYETLLQPITYDIQNDIPNYQSNWKPGSNDNNSSNTGKYIIVVLVILLVIVGFVLVGRFVFKKMKESKNDGDREALLN